MPAALFTVRGINGRILMEVSVGCVKICIVSVLLMVLMVCDTIKD